jgi:hypothetical protein
LKNNEAALQAIQDDPTKKGIYDQILSSIGALNTVIMNQYKQEAEYKNAQMQIASSLEQRLKNSQSMTSMNAEVARTTAESNLGLAGVNVDFAGMERYSQ